MTFDHYKNWKFQIHWGKLEYIIPIKRDKKMNPFCTSSVNCVLKNVKADNNWVGHSVMKPVDDK